MWYSTDFPAILLFFLNAECELRKTGMANGERLFCLMLVSFIRYSLVGDQRMADNFWDIGRLVIPKNILPAAERLAAASRSSDPLVVERAIVGIVGQIYPRVCEDPATRLRFVLSLTAIAGVLNKQTLGALSQAASGSFPEN